MRASSGALAGDAAVGAEVIGDAEVEFDGYVDGFMAVPLDPS
jgi:hypothetical protein